MGDPLKVSLFRSSCDGQSGHRSSPGYRSFGAQLVVGAFWFFVFLAVAVLIVAATDSFVALAVVPLGLLVTVRSAHEQGHARGVLFGILIALGLCLLLVGTCMANLHLGSMN
jgi:hypothetical protein